MRAPARTAARRVGDRGCRYRCGNGCRAWRREWCRSPRPTMRSISWGRVPPLVSHSTIHLAPASPAPHAGNPARRPDWRAQPSKKCSASNTVSRVRLAAWGGRSRSAIILTFSSRDTPGATSTWKSQVLPTRVTTFGAGAQHRLQAGIVLRAERPARRVMPKAARRERASLGGAGGEKRRRRWGWRPASRPRYSRRPAGEVRARSPPCRRR